MEARRDKLAKKSRNNISTFTEIVEALKASTMLCGKDALEKFDARY